MKKKLLAAGMVAALAATAVVGGTLAYFTDAEQKTNTMTIGNVEINIEEVQYGENGWEDYNDGDLVLYPVDNATGAGEFNKTVRTYNTSSSGDDAYIRTIITLDAKLYDYVGLGFCSTGECLDNDERHFSAWEYAGDFKINGIDKSVFVCTDKNKEAIGEDEYLLSLGSVWLYSTVTQKDIEDLGLIDAEGNANFEVGVLSQGIQTYDLSHDEAMAALGAINETNLNDWFRDAEPATINDIFGK